MYVGLVIALLGIILLIKSLIFTELHFIAAAIIMVVVGILLLLAGICSDSKA
jgi:uncharacterized membrane protein HdeD (DUF308 family)